MRIGFLYLLVDPRTNLVRYVGQTLNPKSRMASHKFEWKRKKGNLTHVNSWIKSLSKIGLFPIMEIIDEVFENELDQKEIDYIKLYKSIGARLCNHSIGGRGIRGFSMKKESIEKRNETCKKSELWKEKGKKHSILMKEKHKIGEIKFGYRHLPEDKRKEIGKRHSEKMSIPVLCYDLHGNFICEIKSVRDTAKFLGIVSTNALIDNLKGKRESYRNYNFEYKNKKSNKNKFDKK